MTTFHSDDYFPATRSTGWTRKQFPNLNGHLPNRIWRKQQK